MRNEVPTRIEKLPGSGLISCVYSCYRRLALVLDETRALRLTRAIITPLYGALRRVRFANYHRFYGTSGNDAQYEKLDQAYLDYIASQAVETARDAHYRADFERRHTLRGREHLDASLKLGRGVMLVSGHLGNFYASHAALAHAGYKVTNISEAVPVASMERQIDRLRKTYGVRSLFIDRNAARAGLKVLRGGDILSIVFEVSLRPDEAERLAFGQARLDLDLGPALLAVRRNVPVLGLNVGARRPYHAEVEILPPFPEPTGATERERALNLLTSWRDWLQAEVIKRPEQWWAWSYIQLRPAVEEARP